MTTRAMHRYAVATAAATWGLLIAGGLVTSMDAGLSVPDWPMSYGTWFPPMVGGIAYEHSHRMIAAAVGLLIAGLAGWVRAAEPRRWVRRVAYAALAAVIAQALLGGLTVVLLLPPAVSVAHACLGQTVFCLVALVAAATASGWAGVWPSVADPRVSRASAVLAALLFLQLLLGAVIRHSGRALDAHIAGAVLLVGAIGFLHGMLKRSGSRAPAVRGVAIGLSVLLLAQIALGVAALATGMHPLIATAHLAVGALMLAGSVVLVAGTRQPGGSARPAAAEAMRQSASA